MGRIVITKIDDNGCHRVINRKPNDDGYIRVWDNKDKRLVMLHRKVYEDYNGKIPEGFEIDHVCRIRDCCNPDHLIALNGTEHTIKGNKLRYAERKEKANEYWRQTNCSGTQLAKVFEVTISAACKWIKEWKKASIK